MCVSNRAEKSRWVWSRVNGKHYQPHHSLLLPCVNSATGIKCWVWALSSVRRPTQAEMTTPVLLSAALLLLLPATRTERERHTNFWCFRWCWLLQDATHNLLLFQHIIQAVLQFHFKWWWWTAFSTRLMWPLAPALSQEGSCWEDWRDSWPSIQTLSKKPTLLLVLRVSLWSGFCLD